MNILPYSREEEERFLHRIFTRVDVPISHLGRSKQ